jgi:hypothetical protein
LPTIGDAEGAQSRRKNYREIANIPKTVACPETALALAETLLTFEGRSGDRQKVAKVSETVPYAETTIA